MPSPTAPSSLDHDFLEPLGPKRVKPEERDDQGFVRINSFWMTPAELRSMLPKLAMAKERERVAINESLQAGGGPVDPRPEGIKLLYSKRADGLLMIGAEDIADLLPADDYRRLVQGMARSHARQDIGPKMRYAFHALVTTGKLPGLAEINQKVADDRLRTGLQGQGHVGIAGMFAPTGHMVKEKGRQSGEFWYFPSRNEGVANDKSGRYQSEGVRPDATYDQLNRALTNVAAELSRELGFPVRPEMIKNAGKAPVNPFAGATAGPVQNTDQILPAKAATTAVVQNDKAPNKAVRR